VAALVLAAVPIVAPEPVIVAAPVVESAERRASDLIDIESIGPIYAERLLAAGLNTTEDLMKVGASPGGREDLAAATGISDKLILRWVNVADLFRIEGVGEEYSDRLEAAGVDMGP
jgi:predicted flap endonuclease-1-like 5' DNA nuclease